MQAAASAPAVQPEPSPESMFITEPDGDNVVITGFKTDDEYFTPNAVISETICGKNVVGLKNYNSGASMPGADQVTSLDTSLCTSLTIDSFAFYECTALKSVDLSKCIYVGNDAFRDCTGITKVTWPTDKMTTIPKYCFYRCTSLKTFNSDTEGVCDLTGITSVGSSAFRGCTGITGSIDLSQCTSVGNYAFSGCTGIESVTFPAEKGYTIGSAAFFDTGISGSVDLSQCTSVGNYAFNDCTGISGSVNLSQCTYVGNNAFSGCTGITGSVDLSQCTSVG